MFGKQDARLPKNSAQTAKETKHAPATAAADEIPDAPVNYVSDDEDKDKHGRPPLRRNWRILSQRQPAEGDSLNRIVSLVAKETAVVPPLSVEQQKLIRDYASANLILQLDEWAYNTWFVGVILNEKTGGNLEYRDLIKRPELRERWMSSLANKLGRLSQGICNVKGTNTIYFIPKSEIPQD